MTKTQEQSHEMDTMHRVKHLEMVQDVIRRQAQNSFAVKGWSITLSSAIFAVLLRQSPTHPLSFLIGMVPAFLFWAMDSYYLQQERRFRNLFKAIATEFDKEEHKVKLFDMSTSELKHDNCSRWEIAMSQTVALIPMTIIATSIGLTIIFLL